MTDTRRVLVADDDAEIRALVVQVLTSNGYVVVQARDGLDAMERMTFNDFSVVILDLMMPLVDGFEVLDFIRDQKPQLLAHVIIMTAASLRYVSRLDVTRLGGVIMKPFQPGDLVAMVHTCLMEGTPEETTGTGAII